jgi:photosystem II stability/assembly factor-like uncharacterized protein
MNSLYIKKFAVLYFAITVSVFFAQAQSWTAVSGGPTGGNIRKLTMDANNNLYAVVSDGGDVYKSSNGGVSWSLITGSVNYVHGLEVIGSDLYVNTWSDIYKSTNGGGSWTKVNVTTGMSYLDAGMSFIPGVNGLLAYGTQGVWISVDNGVTWKKIYNQKTYRVAFSSAGDVYITVPSVGILKHEAQSTLANWDQSKFVTIKPKLTAGDDEVATIGVNRNNNNKLFVSYQNAGKSALVYEVSANGGNTWATITSPTSGTPGGYWFSFSGKFYHVIGSDIYDVTDGANITFTKKGKPGFSFYNIVTLYYKNFNEFYAGVEGDGVWKSVDDGGTFAISNGTPPAAIMAMPARDIEVMGSRLMLVPYSDSWGYWTSTNDGANWSWITMPSGIKTFYPHKVFERLQDNSIIVATAAGTYRTTDGQNWTLQSTESFHDYVTVSSTELYGFRAPGTIMKSINNGANWTAVTVPASYPANINDVLAAAYDGVNFYVAMTRPGGQEFWKLNLTNQTAVKMNVALLPHAWRTSALFVFKGKLYIGDGQRVAISNDQGNSFKYIDYTHDYLFPIDQGIGGIGISKAGSLVITQDDGVTFRSTSLPRSEARIVNISSQINGTTTYAATAGSPLLKYTTTSSDTLIYNKATPYIDFGWQKMEGPTGGGYGKRIFKSNSNQLFVSSWSVIHRYNSTASKWESLENLNLTNHDMLHDGTRIYQTTWNGFYKSVDDGNTFVRQSIDQYSETIGNGQSIFKTSDNVLFILSGNGLYRSADEGVTFTKIKSGRAYTDLAEGGTTLLATGYEGSTMFVERSTDGGLTWTAAQSGITFSAILREDLLVADGNNTFVLTTHNNIYRTTDGGIKWTSIFSNLGSIGEANPNWWGNTKVYVAPNGDYYFGANGYPVRLYVSSNKGSSWARKNTNTTNTPFNDLTDMIWDGARIYATSGYQNGVMFSDDGGATFSIFNNNAGMNSFKDFIGGDIKLKDGRIILANGQGLHISNDQGATWNLLNYGVSDILEVGDSLITYAGVMVLSVDKGATWSKIDNNVNLSQLVRTSSKDYIGYAGNKFVTSKDLVNWTDLSVSGLPANFNLFSFESMAALGSKIYLQIYNNNNFQNEFYEVNGGVATKINTDTNPRQVVGRNSKVYFLTYGYLYETSDGTTFNKRAIPDASRIIFANNGYLFLTNENGVVWVSRDSGLSWQNVSLSNLKARVDDISIDLATGVAYGSVASQPLFKTSVNIIPNDGIGPEISYFSPADNATNVAIAGLKLSIVFNESPRKVTGKNLRIYKSTDAITPVETIPISNGVVSDNQITFTPTFIPVDLTTYYVTIDAGAFTDFYGNPSQPILNQTTWNFTMEDATAPTIAFTTSNLEKGVTKTFEVTINDAGGVDNNSVKIYFRGITSNSSFANSVLSAGGSSKYSVTAQESWYDAMGLEFYFEAKDVSGNASRFPATADTYLYSYITYPVAQRPKVTGLSFGTDATAYRIISIPYKLSDSQIATVFDEFGPVNKKAWRMFTYAGDSKWNEFGETSNFTTLERGRGYWVISKSNVELFVEGAQSPENNRTSFFKKTLQPGWNQIGNPYPVSINWNETISGKTGIGSLKKYSNGTWANSDVLNALEGGLVFVTGSAAQEITIRFPGITTGGRQSAGVSSDLSGSAWELPIHVQQGSITNEISGIGMNPKATIYFDPFDDLNMPMPEGFPFALMSFMKQQGAENELAKDVVPTQSEFVWHFQFRTNSDEHATFKWNNGQFGNNSKELILMDEGTQRLMDMRTEHVYTFDPTVSKNFKIYFGEDLMNTIKPSKILLGRAYPNPATERMSVPFTLPEGSPTYRVHLEAYNMFGTPVGVLYEGELTPGFYQRDWSLQAANLANGVYFIKMTVSGSASREIQVQKIIINR